MLFRLFLLAKFAGVLGYAGGLVAAFVASAPEERRRAVHGVASPAMLLTWLAGYGAAAQLGASLLEPWLAGSLGLSFLSQVALVLGPGRGRAGRGAFAAAVAPLGVVLVLMIWRPTWSALGVGGVS